MIETRSPAQSLTTAETGGAIVPVSVQPASIDRYAQDVYLALPRDRQNSQNWEELRTLAEQGGWEQLQTIHNYFTSSSHLQISDNSSRSQVDRHDQHSYADNRSVSYADDRAWNETQISYADNHSDLYYRDDSALSYTDSRSWITHDNRSWDDRTWTDSRQFIDSYSYSYAPEVHNHQFVDNSIYINVDGSFNGNGSNNSASRQISSSHSSDREWSLMDRILGMLVITLCCVLAVGILRGGTALIRSESSPAYYQPMEIR